MTPQSLTNTHTKHGKPRHQPLNCAILLHVWLHLEPMNICCYGEVLQNSVRVTRATSSRITLSDYWSFTLPSWAAGQAAGEGSVSFPWCPPSWKCCRPVEEWFLCQEIPTWPLFHSGLSELHPWMKDQSQKSSKMEYMRYTI